jgi:hypothetical protein
VHRRTALINQIRGFLLDRGITFAKGPANLRNQMPAVLERPDVRDSSVLFFNSLLSTRILSSAYCKNYT